MSRPANPREAQLISQAIARVRAGVLAVVSGLMAGSALLVATIWLVVLGGEEIGPHLGLLNNYLPGYSVSWGGALLGFLYGVLLGGMVGWVTAWLYNRLVELRHPR